MDNKSVSCQAYSKIMEKLNSIHQSLDKQPKKEILADNWMDVQEVCKTLKICKRTLQYYRKSGMIPSSQIGGKIYFKATDVQKTLEINYMKKAKCNEKGKK